MKSPHRVTDPTEAPNLFAAAEDAHGAANPTAHMWADRNHAERFVFAYARFEECETKAGDAVETIVGQLADGSWTREWLFRPDDPDSRGWRAQQLEFIEGIRADMNPGDIVVMELGAERPTMNGDRKTRPFKASHHRREDLPQPEPESEPEPEPEPEPAPEHSGSVHRPLEDDAAAAGETEDDDDLPF